MSKAKKLRRAGSPWRLLVHEPRGVSHHVTSQRSWVGGGDSEWSRTHELPGTEFDELVVGRWLHIEQLDDHLWWLDVGGVTIHVSADRDGQPTKVTVHGPLDWSGETTPGVSYECTWTDPEGGGSNG